MEEINELQRDETDTWMAKKASINGREHEAKMRWDSYDGHGRKGYTQAIFGEPFFGRFSRKIIRRGEPEPG